MRDAERVRSAEEFLQKLCRVKPNRRTGSPGNRAAAAYVAGIVRSWGYDVETTPFDCLDFESDGAALTRGNRTFDLRVSPYTLGCDIEGTLVVASSLQELEALDCQGQILLMRGDLCAEQLMPKEFPFYNPDHHKHIYTVLERKHPGAIITATSRSPELVGAMYPFPLIEDGDFDVSSAFCTDDRGEDIAQWAGKMCRLLIRARRIPATASNVVARKNPDASKKVFVTAHIDAYGDAPGASDDASGVVVLMLLAEALRDYEGNLGIEIAALNGEDNYSAAGEKDYLRKHGAEADQIAVVINIDDVGYIRGGTAYSTYGCPDRMGSLLQETLGCFDGMIEGEPWHQGDHMIFVQHGIPAIAFTSECMPELMATITHSDRDTPDIVDCSKLVELANALETFIRRL